MAANPTDLSEIDAILKDLYVGQKVVDLTYKKNPIFGSLKKFEKMYGRKYPLPNEYAPTGGRSATFSTAQGNIKPPKYEAFELTHVKNYSLARVEGLAAAATEGDSGSFLEELTNEINIAMKRLGRDLEISLPRSKTGSRGVVGTVSSTSLTLSDIGEIVCYEVGDVVVASSTDGGSLDAGSEIVAGVNRNTGVLTSTNVAWTTGIASIAAGRYLYIEGDRNAKISGFEGWIPSTAPTGGDSFFAVDRSIDTRLAGHRYNGSGGLIKDALIGAQSLGAREDGEPDIVWLNHAGYAGLIRELGAKVEYCKVPGRNTAGEIASIGFSGLTLHGEYGPLKVVPANAVPANVAWVLTHDTWCLNSINDAVHLDDRDGNRYLRVADDDAYEVRVRFYGQLGCTNPGANVRCTLPSGLTL